MGQLPASVADLSQLRHLYTSNDASPSSLSGSLPRELGRLSQLQCMYFSHNNLR